MFTFGFYNSLNGDRRYSAEQMGSIFDGIIEDGVFSNVGEMFAVVPGAGMQVIVKTGRAWFNHTWNLNDTWMTLDLDASDLFRSRIDSVVLEVNSDQDVRENTIKIVKGSPAGEPVPPTLVRTKDLNQYRLADVTIGVSATNITTADIAIKVGTDDTPFVSAPLQAMDVTDWFNQWDGQFQEWFKNVQSQLAGDVAANLQRQIDDRVKIEDKADTNDVKNGTSGKWIDAELAKNDLVGLTAGTEIGDIVYTTRDLEKETDGIFLACDQRQISPDDYPELCDTPGMRGRIGKVQYRSNELSYIGTSARTIYGGYVYNDKVLQIQSTNGSPWYVYTRKIDGETIGSSETLATLPTITSLTRLGYRHDNMLVVDIASSGANWHLVNLDTGMVTTHTGEAPSFGSYTITAGNVAGLTVLDDGRVFVLVDFQINSSWKHFLTSYLYSPDFTTRTVRTIEVNSNNTTTTGVINRPLSLPQYGLLNCYIDAYNNDITAAWCDIYYSSGTSGYYVGIVKYDLSSDTLTNKYTSLSSQFSSIIGSGNAAKIIVNKTTINIFGVSNNNIYHVRLDRSGAYQNMRTVLRPTSANWVDICEYYSNTVTMGFTDGLYVDKDTDTCTMTLLDMFVNNSSNKVSVYKVSLNDFNYEVVEQDAILSVVDQSFQNEITTPYCILKIENTMTYKAVYPTSAELCSTEFRKGTYDEETNTLNVAPASYSSNSSTVNDNISSYYMYQLSLIIGSNRLYVGACQAAFNNMPYVCKAGDLLISYAIAPPYTSGGSIVTTTFSLKTQYLPYIRNAYIKAKELTS